jgi:PatG C-terminal
MAPGRRCGSAVDDVRRDEAGYGGGPVAEFAASPESKSGCGCESSMPGGSSGEGRPLRVAAPSFVYAIGRVEPQFPSLAIEKEFAQAVGRAETVDLTDQQAFHRVLAAPENGYLRRHLCYTLSVQGLESYLVLPRDPADFALLIDALDSASKPSSLHVVVGVRGPLSTPDMCNGTILPVVYFDQIYAFAADELVGALPVPETIEDERFRAAAEELFERVLQIADNAGGADEHRALNYLAVRYPPIYAKCAEAHAAGASLSAIETRTSRLSGVRNIVDVLLAFTDRRTDVTEKYFVRVDVTEVFPFLVTKLSPYYDR